MMLCISVGSSPDCQVSGLLSRHKRISCEPHVHSKNKNTKHRLTGHHGTDPGHSWHCGSEVADDNIATCSFRGNGTFPSVKNRTSLKQELPPITTNCCSCVSKLLCGRLRVLYAWRILMLPWLWHERLLAYICWPLRILSWLAAKVWVNPVFSIPVFICFVSLCPL